ncbi:MAG: (2Fe-2S)-binding protein [Sphingomonadaceae bacterium]|nr:(2Fe-2S)-binding protein [Sphingomonadaceae bacterium]
MILCVCNALREDDVRAAARSGATCPNSAYRSLGRRPKCGTCVPAARELIAAERTQRI